MKLPCAVEYVLLVLEGGFFVYGGFRPPVDEIEPASSVFYFASEYFEESVFVDLFGDSLDEFCFALAAVYGGVSLPFFGLAGLYEGEEGLCVEGEASVELFGVAAFVSAVVQ